MKLNLWRKYSFLWVTAILFAGSLLGHWSFAWHAYIEEQEAHNQPVEFSGYLVEVSRDTLENWQSEFLQLMWQVGGLAFLLHIGSPQSKEGDERKEEKLDELLRLMDPDSGDKRIKRIDGKYPKK